MRSLIPVVTAFSHASPGKPVSNSTDGLNPNQPRLVIRFMLVLNPFEKKSS